MIRTNTRWGFTLIELLVVVLIVGILAAVALPQYQRAVVKSKVGTILPLIKSIAIARQLYYLSNSTYTDDINELDVEMPPICSYAGEVSRQAQWKCGEEWLLVLAADQPTVAASYCPGNNSSFGQCTTGTNRDFVIAVNDTEIRCTESSVLGAKICQSINKN